MAKKEVVYIVLRQFKDNAWMIHSVHHTEAGAKAMLEKQVQYGNSINDHYKACWNSPSGMTIYEDGKQWERYYYECKEIAA